MRGGYSADVILINQEGIANAMNMGLDVFHEGNYDAIAYLVNQNYIGTITATL